METTILINKPENIPVAAVEKQEKTSTHFVAKLIMCCIGFVMFEWLAGQTFKDTIGMNALDSWLIGFAFFLLYLIVAIKYKEDMVESMFE